MKFLKFLTFSRGVLFGLTKVTKEGTKEILIYRIRTKYVLHKHHITSINTIIYIIL